MNFRAAPLLRAGFTVAILFTALGPTLGHATMAGQERTGVGGASSAFKKRLRRTQNHRMAASRRSLLACSRLNLRLRHLA